MNNHTEAAISLTERQVEILAAEGLPGEYEALTWTQKKAIIAIEEMLQAVEQKYGREFAYAGYAAKQRLEPECLRAYPVGGDRKKETFIASRKTVNGETVFRDNHLLIASEEKFSRYIESEFKMLAALEEIKVYSTLTELTTDSMPDDHKEFDGRTAAEILIFLDRTSCSAEQLKGIIHSFTAWMREHRIYGAVQYILLKESILPILDRYNYTDYLSENYYQAREFSYLNR